MIILQPFCISKIGQKFKPRQFILPIDLRKLVRKVHQSVMTTDGCVETVPLGMKRTSAMRVLRLIHH